MAEERAVWDMIKPRRWLSTFLVSLAFLNLFCDVTSSLTSTKIKDILEHPRDFENKEVSIYGTVGNTVSLLVVKYFEVQDDTGAIGVVTDRVLPARGQKLKVTGRMVVIEVGTERWVVLRETSATNGDGGTSNNLEKTGNLTE